MLRLSFISSVSNVSETRAPRIGRKGVLITRRIICIVLVACLAGGIAAYTLMMNEKSNAISSLNYGACVARGVSEQLGLQLTMILQKTYFSLGEPVTLTFTITNISNQTINLFHYGVGAFDMFEFQVYNDTDNSVSSLIYPVYPFNPGGPIITTTLLNSEESLTGALVWEQMCNNMVPVSTGTYYVVGQIGPIFANGLTIETTQIQIVIA